MLDALDHDTIDRDLTELERAGYAELAARLRLLVPVPRENGANGQLDLDAPEILPVTDAHMRLAWDAHCAPPPELAQFGVGVTPPDPAHYLDAALLAGLRRVITQDRQLVARESQRLQAPALAAGSLSTPQDNSRSMETV